MQGVTKTEHVALQLAAVDQHAKQIAITLTDNDNNISHNDISGNNDDSSRNNISASSSW